MFRIARQLVFLMILALAACRSRSTAEPPSKVVLIAPAATSEPAATAPQPTATFAALPTPAAHPTSNPALAPTAPPAQPTLAALAVDAQAPLAPDGPWWLLHTPEGLWAMNVDGSGLKQLTYQPIVAPHDLAAGIAPRGAGGRVAFVTAADPNTLRGLTLNLVTLPQGELQLVTRLTSDKTEPSAGAAQGNVSQDVVQAITGPGSRNSLAWSPDGRLLAFMGAQDGPSSDLYTYDVKTGHITRLTDGPSQGFAPVWSPDGKYIVHMGATTFGTGAGYSMAGVWAAPADGSPVKTVYTPRSGDEVIVGWTAPDVFVVYSWSADCGARDLRLVSLENGGTFTLWDGAFSQVALKPAAAALVTVDRYVAQCNPDNQAGLFLILFETHAPRHISELEGRQPIWSSEAEAFFVQAQDGALQVTLTGQVTALPSAPAVSPNGQMRAWRGVQAGRSGLWVDVAQGRSLDVFAESVEAMAWGPDGRALIFWNSGGLYVARGPDFAPALVRRDFQVTASPALVWP